MPEPHVQTTCYVVCTTATDKLSFATFAPQHANIHSVRLQRGHFEANGLLREPTALDTLVPVKLGGHMTDSITPPIAAIRTVLVLLAASASCLALAQQPTRSSGTDVGGIEEVVVTARKRDENLQDVPISITAFSAATIEQRGIESIYDLAKLTPNLSFNQTYGRAFDRPVIRGQSQILGDRTVSFVVDGIYVAGNMSADLDDLEQVEVLKGPQAANFGRGALAGVISYRTRKPTKEWKRHLTLSLGDYGHQEATANISGPLLSDKLSFKLGARYYDFKGQYKGVSTDGSSVRLGAERTKRLSGAVRWQPTDNIDVMLRAFASQNADGLYNNIINKTLNCFQTAPAGRGGSFCGEQPTIPVNGGIKVDFEDIARQGRPGITQDTNLYSLEGNWDVGPGTLTGLVSWNRQDEDWITDDYLINAATSANGSQPISATMTRANPGNITRLITIRNYRSQELRFASKTDGPVDWLLGAYHYDSRTTGFNGGPRYNILATVMGVTAPAATNTGPVGTLRQISQPVSPVLVENQAFFGSVSWDPNDRWHMTLEGRYAKDKLTTNNTVQAITVAGVRYPGNCAAQLNAEFKSFTPRGTVRFDISDNTNVYLSVSKGNKPGDFNSTLCAANINPLEFKRLSDITPLGVKEEKALNYEIGSKMRLLDGRMSLNVAVFKIDWKDQQLTSSQLYENTINPTPATLRPNISLTGNAGKTDVKGLELDWRWKLNSSWDVNIGYGYTDAKFKSLCDPVLAQLLGVTLATQQAPCIAPAGVTTFTANAAGFQTANAPKHTANAGVEFAVPVNERWKFFARADFSYQSERFAEVYNQASTGASKRVDARFGITGDAWRVTAWAKNIGNDRTPDAVVRFFDPDSPGFNRAFQVHFPNGRTVGLTATYDF